MNSIYESDFISQLFGRMSKSYERMNYYTSLGFSERWRKQCVDAANIKKGDTVVDLMTGMGECWPYIVKRTGTEGTLIAADLSPEMLQYAQAKKEQKYTQHSIRLLKENVLNLSIAGNSADVVISAFGLKTFSDEQINEFAQEVYRVLKPGGRFSFIEVSVPRSKWLAVPYLFHLRRVVPGIARLFVKDSEVYTLLGEYTCSFGNAKRAAEIVSRNGLKTHYVSYFGGCATAVTGSKNS